MGALVVVMVDGAGDFGAGFLEVGEPVEPGAFLFEGAVEPLAQAVLVESNRGGTSWERPAKCCGVGLNSFGISH